MKSILKLNLSVCCILSALFVATSLYALPSLAKKPAALKPAIAKSKPKAIASGVPYLKNIQDCPLLAANRSSLTSGWETLYQLFNRKNEVPDQALTPSKEQAASIAPLFEMNYLLAMKNYLDPKTFPKLTNYPTSQLDTNYATGHLLAAVDRLNSVFSMSCSAGMPKSSFRGDNRDLGVIVNIKNNTKAQFSVSQASVGGSQSLQIGQINPGLNGLNLHTAALQSPEGGPKSTGAVPSTSTFNLKEMNSESPTEITICMMSGAEFVEFLRTLPRSKEAIKKDTFEMNGLPTSPEYLVDSSDWYLVLIQNPTDRSAPHRNPGQRIQLINVSKLTGPYLLTMQINAENVEIALDGKKTAEKTSIFQPSFTQAQIMQSQGASVLPVPLLILPQFLWQLPTMQALWMMMSTTLLAEATGYKFFGKDSFGDAFEYFQGLGCFGNQNRYDFFLDRYNKFRIGYVLYNASWLMANAVCETDLGHCSDIPQIYTAQDAYGHVIVNEHSFYYINFLVLFLPSLVKQDSKKIFYEQSFNDAYADPFNQLYSFVVNALREEIKEGIFGNLTEVHDGVYRLTWTNKKNKIINSQVLYLGSKPANIQISFVNQMTDWVGSAVPTQLIQLSPGETSDFKVTYEYSSANSKHILLAQETSPIDKQEVFLPFQFTQYPIQNLYFDLFATFNVAPGLRCNVIKDGVLPEILSGLNELDWQAGIYMVPIIKNNEKLSAQNPGFLTVLFYKSDKSYVGKIIIDGQSIHESIQDYAVSFSENNSIRWLYLSTGVFVRYNKID